MQATSDDQSQPTPSPGVSEKGLPNSVLGTIREGFREALLVAAGLLCVALIALVDYEGGPNLSCGILYLIPVAACAWWGGFPHGILLALGGSVAWHVVDGLENPLLPIAAQVWNGLTRFATLVLTSSLAARLHASIRRERQLARTDPLTGAANGRTFYEAAAQEVERSRRLARPLTLVYLDLDNFKQLNDRLGHAAGDAALVRVVQTIHATLRRTDLLARLGGDEFALLLPETDWHGAGALLARMHQRLELEMTRAGWPVTLSMGAITFDRPPLDLDLMIQQVDAVMYRAKEKGKGRVEHAAVREGLEAQVEEQRQVERRATTRVLCSRAVRVRPDGPAEGPEGYATVCDISVLGVGIYQEQCFPINTLLLVEPLSPGAKPLLARVVNVRQVEGGWRHGCELPTRLAEEELHHWFQGQFETGHGPRTP